MSSAPSSDTDWAPIANPDPVEPTFTLRGADPVACLLMTVWASMHERLGSISPEQFFAATWMSSAMGEGWARAHGEDIDKTVQAWVDVISTAHARLQAMLAERAGAAVH